LFLCRPPKLCRYQIHKRKAGSRNKVCHACDFLVRPRLVIFVNLPTQTFLFWRIFICFAFHDPNLRFFANRFLMCLMFCFPFFCLYLLLFLHLLYFHRYNIYTKMSSSQSRHKCDDCADINAIDCADINVVYIYINLIDIIYTNFINTIHTWTVAVLCWQIVTTITLMS